MDLSTLHIEVDKTTGHKVVNLRYELMQSIGQGQFGKVLLARDRSLLPTQHYAIKTINRIDKSRLITKTYMSHTTKIKREIRIMKECDHPNVVKLYQVIDDLRFDKILLVLEYCQYGEIDWKSYNHYHEKYFKDASRALPLNRVLRDVANGLQYLHQFKHIIHRDLKPSNLLISRDRTIKISDFGVSLILENNANDDRELCKTMGTPAFFAPELCQFVNKRLLMLSDCDLAHSKIDARIDLWSLGVVLYCLFYHQLPFDGHNEYSLFKNIVNDPLRFPRTSESAHARPLDATEAAFLQDLVQKLLLKDPAQRPTLDKIKHHRFTTFDLSATEANAFYNTNIQIFKAQGAHTDNSLTGRIRRLIVGQAAETIKPSTVPPVADVPDPKLVHGDLEHVDDLLDSYFDESSSLGSLDDASLHESNFFAKPTLLAPELKRPSSSGLVTPVNASAPVVIGAGSPLSIKSMFSPSRRFFARLKKQKQPTLDSLASAGPSDNFDFEPPPGVGGVSRTLLSRCELAGSVDSGARKGRQGSCSSVGLNGLLKLSSSCSSLNLQAYLADGASPVKTSTAKTSHTSNEGSELGFDPPEETTYVESPFESSHRHSSQESSDYNADADRTFSMDEYLEQLSAGPRTRR
ncbi:kinase-like protein [Metschnikowia bicuspidata]|uniref:Kinase-like protein n=1 Tax=Metschnikowia bicuspidata TaxID=27322 RepID=A0A4P9ZGK9_9ASCO|nr:kinase-like protein [Metschnikowia bicuspidata]